MNDVWKLDSTVSIPAHIFDTIQQPTTKQPICFVLFGADCHFKKEIQQLTGSWLHGFTRLCFNLKDATKLIKPPRKVLVELNAKESKDRELYQKLIQDMRAAGAETIIGIHAKAAKQSTGFLERILVNKEIDTIESHGPKDEDFDHFIVVEEGE